MQIELNKRTLHFRKPARTSRGQYTEHHLLKVTMYDEQGRIGVGECAPLPDLSPDAHAYDDLSQVARLIEEIFQAPRLSSSLSPSKLPSELCHPSPVREGNITFEQIASSSAGVSSPSLTGEGWQGGAASPDGERLWSELEGLRAYPALLFALESALYDLRQTPFLYQTPFARSQEGIPTNGLVWMDTYDGMLRQAKQKILAGFRCIKFKIGALDWDDELRLITLLRSRFSPDTLQIRLDANGAFAPDEALSRLRELAPLGIHSIEQPVRQYLWDDTARLCRESPIPIALDEELIGVYRLSDKQKLLDDLRPQYIVIKPTLHGGMSGALEWVSESRKRGIGSWMTSALESNIGLRNVALLAAAAYGPRIRFPQGLGTGLLFTDNIPMDIELRRTQLWRCEVEDPPPAPHRSQSGLLPR